MSQIEKDTSLTLSQNKEPQLKAAKALTLTFPFYYINTFPRELFCG